MRGKLITFEGSEGSGKSTQIAFVHRYLQREKRPVVVIREPGGVKISEKIRSILLDPTNQGMSPECETLLYMAARAQLVYETIEPALKKGKIVLCDRFLDSTVVYQGYGCGVDLDLIQTLGRFATRRIKPDLTFLFDIEVKKGLSRIKRKKDRIEKRSLAYHNRVRQGYRALARQEPRRIVLIQGHKNREEIRDIVQRHIERLIK